MVQTLTDDENGIYVYFDNGLAGYDKVEFSLDEGNTFIPMVNLEELSKLSGNIPGTESVTYESLAVALNDLDKTNVAELYTFVTPVKIAEGEPIKFRGTASGKVFDAISYQGLDYESEKRGALREWGYQYENFQWTTSESLSVSAENNCYYAPVLAMQYKYTDDNVATSSGGDKGYHVLIKKFKSYPTIPSVVYYDAQYTLEGEFGALNSINLSGINSQSADSEGSYALGDGNSGLRGTVYRANAVIYDYYSDWELSGRPLSELTDSYAHNSSEIIPGGSFSQNTDSLSYSYQGYSLNEIIADYYLSHSSSENPLKPLYFGSNNLFSGLIGATNSNDAAYFNIFGGEEASVTSYENDVFYVWNRLQRGGILDYQRTAHGGSNSRAVTNLVKRVDGTLQLPGTSIPLAYFDESFLTGTNNKNAVYADVYDNVSFDFELNEQTGYYEFDSTKSQHATRLTKNTSNGSYYMRYTNEGVKKGYEAQNSQTLYQFYPFNSPAANESLAMENLMFGMKLSIPFNLKKDDNNGNIFKFSGDDDVWIYVDDEDDVLLDIGGTHTAVGGVIDFDSRYAVVGSTYSEQTGGTSGGINAGQKMAFAAGVALGVKNHDITTIDSASFFDNTYTNVEFSATIDEENGLYIVMLYGENAGEYKFLLNKVPDSVYVNSGSELLTEHVLTIYYMERGLNSSNFKLAFKFTPNTDITVQKEWADSLDHSDDNVSVALYQAAEQKTAFATTHMPPNTEAILVRLLPKDHNNQDMTGISKFMRPSTAEEPSTAEIISDVHSGMNTFATLTINGFTLTKENFPFLQSGMEMTITKIAADNTETIITADDFLNSSAQQSGADKERVYIKVEKNERLKVVFSVKSVVDNGYPSIDDPCIWSIPHADGWLVELRAYGYDEKGILSQCNIQGVSTVNGEPPNFDQEDIVPDPYDVNFVILQSIRSREIANDGNGKINGHIYFSYVSTVLDGGSIEFDTKVNEKERFIHLWQISKWSGTTFSLGDDPDIFFSEDIKLVDGAIYGGGTKWVYTLNNITKDQYFFIFALNNNLIKDENYWSLLETPTFERSYPLYTYKYTDIKKFDLENKILSSESNWEYQWKNLPVIGDDNIRYTYFIREEEISSYTAKYFNAQGRELTPQTFTINDDEIEVFPVRDMVYIKIVNTPQCSLSISKTWLNQGLNQPPDSIVINIYTSDGVLRKSLPINPDDFGQWHTTCDTLTGYFMNAEGKYAPIDYYAAEAEIYDTEGKLIDFNPTFSIGEDLIDGELLNLSDGNTITAYKFNLIGTSNIEISIENTLEPLFNFILEKVDETDSNLKLSGAEFTLEKLEDIDFANLTYITDESGIIDFGNLPYGKYCLTEITAPIGYKLYTEPITFTVDENGYAFDSATPNTQNIADWDEDKPMLSLKLSNQLRNVIMLPNTGGRGTAKYYLIGGLFITFLLLHTAYSFFKKRKEK